MLSGSATIASSQSFSMIQRRMPQRSPKLTLLRSSKWTH
jgi:hypothetical protein